MFVSNLLFVPCCDSVAVNGNSHVNYNGRQRVKEAADLFDNSFVSLARALLVAFRLSHRYV
jgi:hypothetical protein